MSNSAWKDIVRQTLAEQYLPDDPVGYQLALQKLEPERFTGTMAGRGLFNFDDPTDFLSKLSSVAVSSPKQIEATYRVIE